jgi:pilus assembly protein CpaB
MQKRRALLFLALSALLATAAVLTARRFVERSRAVVEAPVETTRVVVVRADVPVGSALSRTQLADVEWPRRLLPQGTFSDPGLLEGRVLRRALAAGEPVLEVSLLPQGAEAGLVSVISEKQRAVSVKVDPVIGVAGFVTPGSRVDVLATLRRVDQSQKLPYSKVVLQDVPVLAIDQKMEEAENGEPKLVSVVTLQVSPEQAEQLIYSSHEGRLQLALRSPADREIVPTTSVGVADVLGGRRSPAPALARKNSGLGVEVLRGATLSRKAF